MRLSLFEHENRLTTTDFIFSFLHLQAKGEYSIILEGHMFERMTQVASTGFSAGPMMQKLGLTSVLCLHYDL
jgi:hypothetical protein